MTKTERRAIERTAAVAEAEARLTGECCETCVHAYVSQMRSSAWCECLRPASGTNNLPLQNLRWREWYHRCAYWGPRSMTMRPR